MSADSAPPSAPVDEAAFAAMIGGTGFSDLHIELVGMFLAESSGVLDDIGRAIDADDRDVARRLGHRMKGSASAVAAARASASAAVIEAEAMTIEHDQLRAQLAELRSRVDDVRAWYVAGGGTAG